MASDEFIKEERRWEAAQQEREDRNARARREAWNTRIGYISMAMAVIAIVAIIAFTFWRLSTTWSNNDTARINACTEQGGTWTTIGGGQGAPEVCVYLRVDPK